jgi:hypothetical protein
MVALLAVAGAAIAALSSQPARSSATGTQRPAAAQVRPDYVKNVDEPGLVTFKMSFRVTQTDCSCTKCRFVESETVPAGRR